MGVLAPLLLVVTPVAVDGRPLDEVGRLVIPEMGLVITSLVGRLFRPRFSSFAKRRSSLFPPPKPNQDVRDGVGASGMTAGAEAEWWMVEEEGDESAVGRDCDEVEALLSVRARALASLVR